MVGLVEGGGGTGVGVGVGVGVGAAVAEEAAACACAGSKFAVCVGAPQAASNSAALRLRIMLPDFFRFCGRETACERNVICSRHEDMLAFPPIVFCPAVATEWSGEAAACTDPQWRAENEAAVKLEQCDLGLSSSHQKLRRDTGRQLRRLAYACEGMRGAGLE